MGLAGLDGGADGLGQGCAGAALGGYGGGLGGWGMAFLPLVFPPLGGDVNKRIRVVRGEWGCRVIVDLGGIVGRRGGWAVGW